MIEFNYFVEDELKEFTAKRHVSMQVATDEKTIDDLTEAFQDFLVAAGFVIDPLRQKIMLVRDENGAF